jgi:Ca2+-binding RTX toxin-like protein
MAILVNVTSPAPVGSDCRIIDFLTNATIDTSARDPAQFLAHDPNLTLGSAIDLTIRSSLNNIGYDGSDNVNAGTIDQIVITSAVDGIDRVTLSGLNIDAAALYNAMVADDTAALENLVFNADSFTYTGDSGNDSFTAGFLNDNINGMAGDDTLRGSDGNDTLNGGAGNDILSGGFGNNTFVVSTGNDTVIDFRSSFFSNLNAASQVPVTGSGATASANIDYDPVLNTLQVTLLTVGLDWDGAQTPGTTDDDVTGFHIHNGNAGVNGPIVWDIFGDADIAIDPITGIVTATWTPADTTGGISASTFINRLLTDGLYLNIHTNQFPSGAIRGQVLHDANKVDLTSLNIGTLEAWQAVTADLAGSARMTIFDNGVASSLTLTGMPEAAFKASDFIFAGNVAQTINGTNNIDFKFGAGGNDTINGLAGNDRLFGETGNDMLRGGSGIDRLDGGSGNDMFRITGNEGLGDTFIGGSGADILRVFGTANATLSNFNASAASISTWTGNGKGLMGTTAANTFNLSGLTAKSGLLFVDGGNGNDIIVGTKFADDLRGGSGNDKLTGGLGKDILMGGAGDDDFDYNAVQETGKTKSTADLLKGFQHGHDDVDLSTIDANGSMAGNGAFKFLAAEGAAFTGVRGQLRWDKQNLPGTSNDMTVIQGDINGDMKVDFQINLSGLINLTKGDFAL